MNDQVHPRPAGGMVAMRLDSANIMSLQGSFRESRDLNAKLVWASQNLNLITPSPQVGALPMGCEVVMVAMIIDPDTKRGDVYQVTGGLALSAVAISKIATALGISWNPILSRRTDDGSNPHYCAWRAVGTYRHFDGSPQTIVGNKEMDLRDGSPQIEAIKAKIRDGKDPTAQLREIRSFISAHAETKARLRAVASMGVKRSYQPSDLAKPFVVAKLQLTGRVPGRPDMERFFAGELSRSMLGGSSMLFGEAPVETDHGQAPPPIGAIAYDDDDMAAAAETYGQNAEHGAPPPAQPPARSQGGYGPSQAQPPARSQGGYGPPPGQGDTAGGDHGYAEAPPAPAPTFRYGTKKGSPLNSSDITVRDLDWYAGSIRKSVDEPDKERFRAQNIAHLAEVDAELRARQGGYPDDGQAPGQGNFDDIPIGAGARPSASR